MENDKHCGAEELRRRKKQMKRERERERGLSRKKDLGSHNFFFFIRNIFKLWVCGFIYLFIIIIIIYNSRPCFTMDF